jgi:hypothetical protein
MANVGNVGYTISKADFDNRIGAAVVNLRNAFREIVSIKAELDDATILPDSTLITLGYASPADTTQIRNSFTDLAKLYDISRNLATQGVTNDFWFSAKHLAGLNFNT